MKALEPGSLNVIMDAQAGSSGKGKLAAYIMDTEHFDFACNAFFPNAGHWVRLTSDPSDCYFYQQLNSCAWMFNPKYNMRTWDKMMFIGPGSIIELPALLREIEQNHVTPKNLKISPLAVILQSIDSAYERGEVDFNGLPSSHDGTMKHGSTCHGVGAANARRILRNSQLVTAKDIYELAPYISYSISEEIVDRINCGQTGVLELAQGYQLSVLHEHFYPHTTSRNVTVAQGLSDMFLPPSILGNVILNFRTFPIRINSKKFIGADGTHLTYEEVQNGVPHTVYRGDSGNWYSDQEEISWEKLTADSGSSTEICEMTSVTKLPRRVATFSTKNLVESVMMNLPPAGMDGIRLAINFANYVDSSLEGASEFGRVASNEKFVAWVEKYIPREYQGMIYLIGTGRYHQDMVSTEVAF